MLIGTGGKPNTRATPDIVFKQRSADTFPVIIEVNYKPATTKIDRDDLNQAITYGLAYKSPVVVLAQPRGDAGTPSGITTLGTIDGIRIDRLLMELSAANLAAEERATCDALRHLV